jgi:hypothetical protein
VRSFGGDEGSGVHGRGGSNGGRVVGRRREKRRGWREVVVEVFGRGGEIGGWRKGDG